MIHVVSHGDTDGIACVAQLREHFQGEKVEYTLTSYNDVDAKVRDLLGRKGWDELWITDLSCSLKMMEELDHAFYNRQRIVMCDHHKTSAQYKGKYPWFYHDGTLCGAQVTAAALKMPTHTAFLKIVQAWDIWILEPKDWRRAAEDFNRYALFLGAPALLKLCAQKGLVATKGLDPVEFLALCGPNAIETIKTLREKERRQVKQGCSRCVKMTDPYGNKYAFVVAKHNLGQMGQYLKEQLVKNPIPAAYAHLSGCCYMLSLNLEFATVSLRATQDGFDTTGIAKKHGGGGHPGASGFPMKEEWAPDLAHWLWDRELTYVQYMEDVSLEKKNA